MRAVYQAPVLPVPQVGLGTGQETDLISRGGVLLVCWAPSGPTAQHRLEGALAAAVHLHSCSHCLKACPPGVIARQVSQPVILQARILT